MTSSWNRGLWAALWIAALACGSWILPLRADDKAGGAEAKKTAPAAAKPKPAEPDPFLVPEGTPEQLRQYLEGLTQQRPKSMEPEAIREFREKLGQAVLTAAERILAAKSTDEQAAEAIQAKAQALLILERAGRAEAAKKLEDFPADLEKAGRSKSLVRQARVAVLGIRLGKAARTGPKELETVIGEIRQFVAQGPIEPGHIQLAMSAAMAAEQTEQPKLAADTFRALGALVAASKEPQFASIGAKMLGAARRLTILGKPMEIQGKTCDGKPFDEAQYKGKVVLVDFWATWCGPCVEEIENIRDNYAAYHDQGFDVVGISIDEDHKEVEAFLKKKQIPWTVLLNEEPKRDQPDRSMATQYGIFGVPSVFLIGRDGKVIATDVLGEQLAEHLQKLLGPPKKKEKPADGKPK